MGEAVKQASCKKANIDYIKKNKNKGRTLAKNSTYSKVQVLGQRVNEDHLACSSSPIQADGSVEVIVPKHGAAHQSDAQSYNQHQQQGDEPA